MLRLAEKVEMLVRVMPELADESQPNGVRYIRNVAGGKPTWRKHLATQTDRYSLPTPSVSLSLLVSLSIPISLSPSTK